MTRRSFKRINWLAEREDDKKEIVSVHFALIEESEHGCLETLAIFDVVYYAENREFFWDTTRLYIKPEIIGFNSVFDVVRSGEGLEGRERADMLSIQFKLVRLFEYWENNTYPIEYYEYCENPASAENKRRNPEEVSRMLNNILFEREIYDEMDRVNYIIEISNFRYKDAIQIRL